MTQTFDFFYDFGSPYTFLVHKLLPDIEARTGATAIYKPMLLGGVFKATGNMSPIHVPSKLAYQTTDIPLCATSWSQKSPQRTFSSYDYQPHARCHFCRWKTL